VFSQFHAHACCEGFHFSSFKTHTIRSFNLPCSTYFPNPFSLISMEFPPFSDLLIYR
jgi:hypothetical protein